MRGADGLLNGWMGEHFGRSWCKPPLRGTYVFKQPSHVSLCDAGAVMSVVLLQPLRRSHQGCGHICTP
jgi:hypothetical protein